MPAHQPLDLTFTSELRSRIDGFLASIAEYEPTLVLMKGRPLPYAAERWDYGAYRPDDVRLVRAALQRRGRPLLFLAHERVVAIPQWHLLRELAGRILGLDDKGAIAIVGAHRAG